MVTANKVTEAMRLSVNRPDVVIGQLVDEGRLSRSEEDETASSSSNTSRPTDTMNVLCCCCRRSVLKTHKLVLLSSKWEGGS